MTTEAAAGFDEALVKTSNWADEDWIHAQFAWLRANDPVRWMAPDGYDPFFSVTRHADIKAIEADKKLFVNDPRPILAPTAARTHHPASCQAAPSGALAGHHGRPGPQPLPGPHPALVHGRQPAQAGGAHRAAGDGVRGPPGGPRRRMRFRQGRGHLVSAARDHDDPRRSRRGRAADAEAHPGTPSAAATRTCADPSSRNR